MTSVAELRARTPFVGRATELRALDDLLRGQTRIVHLHGIAGIGKTALVHTFVEHAQQAGATVVELDCRAIEPTVRGLREAIVAGADDEGLADHLGRLLAPVVLVLDHCELFRLMDTWAAAGAFAGAIPRCESAARRPGAAGSGLVSRAGIPKLATRA
ncbi:MAG TPA: ATP-binding protein, partial [Propionibacteriaceae bacterium]|nr:ATP-binding protein [Propionibacteriaceae bacterium]